MQSRSDATAGFFFAVFCNGLKYFGLDCEGFSPAISCCPTPVVIGQRMPQRDAEPGIQPLTIAD